jgi:NAD(P)-dependent dehydrogenase (short-subunit alcohol dehydrogenase family)
MGRVEGKVALVTGGASGIGLATAKLLAEEGAKVVVADLAGATSERSVTALDGKISCVVLDVTREGDWIAATDAIMRDLGGLDILVNNAGVGLLKDIEATTLEEWRRVMAVNLDGVFLGCKHAIRVMKDRNGGSIINLSSIAGIVGHGSFAAYCASKGGVRLLTKSVALHCARKGYNIRCNSVHPTFIDTPILDKYRDRFGNDVMQQKLGRQVPIGRLGRPEEVGWALVFLASDESSFMTGSEVVIDGGFSYARPPSRTDAARGL